MRLAFGITAAAALMLSLPAAPAQAQGRQDFSLVNRTGYTINELYVGPTSSDQWGSDILGTGTLPNGRTIEIRFPNRSAECMWDLKVVYDDGDETEWRNVNLCRISRISLFWDRGAGTTRAVAE